MKKFISLLIMSICMVFSMQAQTTVNLNGGKELDLSVTKWYAYNGLTSDRLVPVTGGAQKDTTDYILRVKNQGSGPLHFYAVITMDTVAGIDTTIRVEVLEKKFATEDYTTLITAATTGGAIRNDTDIVRTSLGVTNIETNTTASYASTTAAYNSVTATATDLFRGTIIANNDTLTVAERTMVNAAQTMTNAAQSMTNVANTVLYYKYLKFRLSLLGNDAVGTGVKIKRIEIQFFN